MEVREEVRQMARPLADEAGFELVDVELVPQGRRRIVRVLLDKAGGITTSDCAQFSRRLEDCLDMNQTIPGSYSLEVSSPGIQRPLRTLEAVGRFTGQRTALTAYEAKDGRRNFDGTLLGPSEGRVGVRTDDGNEHWFEWAEVKSAHLVVDPLAALRSAGNRRRDGGPR